MSRAGPQRRASQHRADEDRAGCAAAQCVDDVCEGSRTPPTLLTRWSPGPRWPSRHGPRAAIALVVLHDLADQRRTPPDPAGHRRLPRRRDPPNLRNALAATRATSRKRPFGDRPSLATNGPLSPSTIVTYAIETIPSTTVIPAGTPPGSLALPFPTRAGVLGPMSPDALHVATAGGRLAPLWPCRADTTRRDRTPPRRPTLRVARPRLRPKHPHPMSVGEISPHARRHLATSRRTYRHHWLARPALGASLARARLTPSDVYSGVGVGVGVGLGGMGRGGGA